MSNLDFSVPGKEELAERVKALVSQMPPHYQERYAAICEQARQTIDGVVMSEVYEALYQGVVGIPSLIVTIQMVRDMTKCDSFVYRKQRFERMTEAI